MDDEIVYLGVTNQRTATNRDGHRVTVSRKALRAGVNLVATDLLSVLPVFASIIEEVMKDGHRVICFHDDCRLYGISNGFDVLNIGGKINNGRIKESDGEHIAAYAIKHPKQNIFVDLSALDAGSPARCIAEFDKTYQAERPNDGDFELMAHYGIHRSLTRTRDGIGDTRAIHDAMRFQHLAGMRNIGILNAANSLSELPREFVTNCPNLAFGRIVIPKHYDELKSHVPAEDMTRIHVCKKDNGHGITKVANGPLTYYPGTDVPNDTGQEMPFILMPAPLKSNIGKDPEGRGGPKKNRHIDKFATFIETSRQDKLDRANAERSERIAEKAIRAMKDKAIKAGAVARAQHENDLPIAMRPVRSQRKTGSIANDNVVRLAFGHSEAGTQDGKGIIMMMLQAADVPHAEILSSHGHQAVNAQDGLFNAPSRSGPTPQALALHIIGDALVQEAILAGHAVSERERERGNPVNAAAVAGAYLKALRDDEHLARRFHAEEIDRDAGDTLNRLRQIGIEATGARMNEAQFQVVRSAWARFLSNGAALPSAA